MQENIVSNGLKRLSTFQLLNFCLGFFGLQFAWQMRIILSGPVTEGFGANPMLFGLIWLAGPFTGMIVQPVIGALSDKTHTKFGRRRPYLLGGAVLAAIALWAFPNSGNIAEFLGGITGSSLPVWSGLLIAAIMIWVIDACVNVAQGPYRALVPDIVPPEQHSIANSFLSFAIGLGSVVAAGTAPVLKMIFNYQMSINAQFIMAALAFLLAMLWTCITIQEGQAPAAESAQADEKIKDPGFIENLKGFFQLSPEVAKICIVQFFTWIGIMCMFIFFTQFAVHNVFGVPDVATDGTALASFNSAKLDGTNFSSICFAVFNLICFVISIPIGILSTKFGNKLVHAICVTIMALAFLAMAFTVNTNVIMAAMAVAGIGWASVLALPFAMLSEYIKPGMEGSVMGIFNIFIAGPQVLVCTLLAWFINQNAFNTQTGTFYHYEYAFIIGGIVLLLAAIASLTIKEKQV
ncbi:MAG: MFS transporter [Candidatus Gastranaerophilales bacterium]|nr:MFS transporter [Candidatus Gastranaerophilales bacterium]